MSSLPDFPLPPPLKTGNRVLQHPWALWTQKKSKKNPGASWYDGTQCIGRFNTIEGFWQIYSHMVRADHLNGSVDIMVFHDGIKPFWEDESNKFGGRWTLRCRKAGAAVIWEELLLALLGEQSEHGNDICGAVLSVRYHDDHISVWNRSADNEQAVAGIRDLIVRTLALPSSVPFEYNRHKHHDKEKSAAHAAADGEHAPSTAPATHTHTHAHASHAHPVAHAHPAAHDAPAGSSGAAAGPREHGSGWRMSNRSGGDSRPAGSGPPPLSNSMSGGPSRSEMDAVPLTLRRTTLVSSSAGNTPNAMPAGSSQDSAGLPAGSPAGASGESKPSASPWAKPTTPWTAPEPGSSPGAGAGAGAGAGKSPWAGPNAGPLPGQAVNAGSRSGGPSPYGSAGAPPLPFGAPPPPAMPSSAALAVGGARRQGAGTGQGPRPMGMAARGAARREGGNPGRPEEGGAEDDGWTTVAKK